MIKKVLGSSLCASSVRGMRGPRFLVLVHQRIRNHRISKVALAPCGVGLLCESDGFVLGVKGQCNGIMPPTMMTRSVGRSAAASQGGGTGGQGSEVNGSVNEVPDFSTIIEQYLQNLLPSLSRRPRYWNYYSHAGRKKVSSYIRNAFKDVE
ncbi:hypothetical protein Tco_1362016 [Tanacetum coccineum]